MSVDTAVQILVGAVLLILGRKLFWVFVGAAGFLVGLNFAEGMLAGRPSWMVLTVALALAILGAVLAIFLQKVMVAIAGFLIGGYLMLELLRAASISTPHSWAWAAYVMGGIIGAVLVLILFDWALIILSSLAGAVLITQHLYLGSLTAVILTLALLTIGIIVQASLMRKRGTADRAGAVE
jgi:hypothetical protein